MQTVSSKEGARIVPRAVCLISRALRFHQVTETALRGSKDLLVLVSLSFVPLGIFACLIGQGSHHGLGLGVGGKLLRVFFSLHSDLAKIVNTHFGDTADCSRPNLASVLQEGPKNTSIHVSTGVIGEIPANSGR